ncbi:DUF4873 domain-containing protein [Saccharopolyspora sp. ID03-671]|uniref:DUF4873 domain-containing protein n=1 Tax=Saccharopolyspora sp. ID03-671 TaxID=3073066 RepID=UPI00324BFBAC
MTDAHEDDDYRGPAVVVTQDREIRVNVVLRGHFQPIDGRYHWYGRLAASEEITELAAHGRVEVVLRTAGTEAPGPLSDRDPWGRLRISGLGRPPFALPTSLDDPAEPTTTPAPTQNRS